MNKKHHILHYSYNSPFSNMHIFTMVSRWDIIIVSSNLVFRARSQGWVLGQNEHENELCGIPMQYKH